MRFINEMRRPRSSEMKKNDTPARLVLGIETCTPSGGVALADVEGRLIVHRHGVARTGYSRRLMASIDEALRSASADPSALAAVAVTHGPGSFTGVRVGLVTAKTLAQSLGVPLYIESSLRALAMRWPGADGPVCSILDARRKEVYSGVFRRSPEAATNGGVQSEMTPIRDEAVESIQSLIEGIEGIAGPSTAPAQSTGRIWLSGDGARLYEAKLRDALGDRIAFVPEPWGSPAPDVIALEGARRLREALPGVDPLSAVPQYLRISDAEKGLLSNPT